MTRILCRIFVLALLSFTMLTVSAQAVPGETKPYRILTSGKQVTIKSVKGIRQVMVWTTSGNRVVEQKGMNTNSYSMNIPVQHKAFFLMIGLSDGKIYTEKIGIP